MTSAALSQQNGVFLFCPNQRAALIITFQPATFQPLSLSVISVVNKMTTGEETAMVRKYF
jgi:hypothetical protein